MQMDQIGQGIAARRKQLKLSQEELARKIGVTRQAVSRWESGTALPSVDNMIELSRALEISVDELLQLTPQEREFTLTPQSIGLLLDEHTSRQEKRMRLLTIALVMAALLLVGAIALSTAASLFRASRTEKLLNERINGINRTVSDSLSSMDARISHTVQQAVIDGNSSLTDSSAHTSYDHGTRSFVVTLRAQVKELGDYADAEFFMLSSGGQRYSAPAEMTASGLSASVSIPDVGQDLLSGTAYLSWQENGETITEKIPYYDTAACQFRLEIDWLGLNTRTRQGHDLSVNPHVLISYSYEAPNTYPVSIRYDIYHSDELLKTMTAPITIPYSEIDRNVLPAQLSHTLPDFIALEGITSTDGLMLRVTVTDALGREFIKEFTPA